MSHSRRGPRPVKSVRKPRTPEYRSWCHMKERCGNPRCREFPRYGAKGVRVCPRWAESFAAFLADVGPKPTPEHTLDRFPDGKGNYEPGNVRWATKKEQGRNTSRNRLLTHGGLTLTVAEWSEKTGVKSGTIRMRLRLGLSVADALQPRTRKQPRPKPLVKARTVDYGTLRPAGRGSRFIDLAGLPPFGRLTALECVGRKGSSTFWRCRCKCGSETVVTARNLRSGHTTSCGCKKRVSPAANFRHRMTGTRTYRAWQQAKTRCYNPKDQAYPSYGGSGIKVCERWRDSFEAFLADMGPAPSDAHSLDRYPDGAGDYRPGNCRWATAAQQNANRRNCRRPK